MLSKSVFTCLAAAAFVAATSDRPSRDLNREPSLAEEAALSFPKPAKRVRLAPTNNIGHRSTSALCQFLTIATQQAPLFDDVVGDGGYRHRGCVEAQ
jgi:hypothetical protein